MTSWPSPLQKHPVWGYTIFPGGAGTSSVPSLHFSGYPSDVSFQDPFPRHQANVSWLDFEKELSVTALPRKAMFTGTGTVWKLPQVRSELEVIMVVMQ